MSDPVFHRPTNPLPLAVVAAAAGCDLPPGCDAQRVVTGLAALAFAGPDQVALALDADATCDLAATRAAACVVAPQLRDKVPAATIALVSDAPAEAFARLAMLLDPETRRPSGWAGASSIDPRACVAVDARLEPGVRVAPGAVIGAGVEVGSATTIGVNAVLEAGVRIGRGCAIGAHVTLGHALVGDCVVIHPGARVGVVEPGCACLGRTIVQDAVEIGANAAIARGGLADTVLGEGAVVAPCAFVARDTVVPRLARIGVSSA